MRLASDAIDLQRRIPELDGIRGIAIGMVLFFHCIGVILQTRPGSFLAYALVPARLTWTGVDLFFVLSGFLIGGILIDAHRSRNYYSVFYVRRCLRILPVYALCVSGVFLLNILVSHGMLTRFWWMLTDRLPWMTYPLFLQNFWMAARGSLGSYGLGGTWSLAVEEQFYLTLPLLIRVVPFRRLPVALIIGVASAPLLRVLLRLVWPKLTYTSFVLMPCRADALLLGVLAAYLMRDPLWREKLEANRRMLWSFLLIGFVGLGFLTILVHGLDSFLMASIGHSWVALTYVCLLLCGLLNRESALGRILRWRWLGWLGTIAYGTYLFHEFVLGAFFGVATSKPPMITGLGSLALAFAAVATVLVLCRVLWLYFEKPLVQFGHRFVYESETEPEGVVPQVVSPARQS